MTFQDLGLASAILSLLEKAGFTIPTPIQSESLPVALKGEDIIAVAQTGSGKTLAYVLAILMGLEKKTSHRALILTPSRETAEQTARFIHQFSNQSVVLASPGVPAKTLDKELKKNPAIIVATPGRLSEQLQNNKLLLQNLSQLVIDEADRMLDLGFEPQLKMIQSTLRGQWQTLLFAATFGPKAEKVAELFLKTKPVRIQPENTETPVSSLKQKVYFLSPAQKNNRLLDELKQTKEGVIVFADSQESCVEIARFLTHHQFKNDFIHGDMNAGHRNRIIREFREKRFSILVSTDLLARGLDVDHVMTVISYQLPYKFEDFLHRIGRTARAGRSGEAITFVTPADERTYRKIKKFLVDATEKTLMKDFKFLKA